MVCVKATVENVEQVLKLVSLEKIRCLVRVSSIFSMLKHGETTPPLRLLSRLAGRGFGKFRENLKNALDF